MESIGRILKAERERRGLSLEQVHETTRITIPNLIALEEDRFDHFPNRVYARAFLRDYANFLALDSAELLDRYEQEWAPARVQDQPRPERSVWRTLGYLVLAVAVLGILGAAGYIGWNAYEKRSSPASVPHRQAERESKEVATMPRVPAVPRPPEEQTQQAPELPAAPGEPTEQASAPEAQQPVAETQQPAEPEKLTLEVKAVRNVWVRVKTDGAVAFDGYLPAQAVKSFEARQSIHIRTGMADAVQLKLNGEPQPPLGTVREIGDRTFRRGGSQ